jgi:hypothetical protein
MFHIALLASATGFFLSCIYGLREEKVTYTTLVLLDDLMIGMGLWLASVWLPVIFATSGWLSVVI